MLYVALVAIAVLAAVVLAFAGLLRSVQRTHARERELLVNQLLHVVGHSWQPAPAAVVPAREEIGEDEWFRRHEPVYSATPEQDPELAF